MGIPKYAGKRLTITMPEEIFTYIETLAKDETRSNAQMGLTLIKEALEKRGIVINE
ncbi:MAG: hypothetical protein AAF378_18425 [Cyanobacteria bacterium P01_A01_bin.84]